MTKDQARDVIAVLEKALNGLCDEIGGTQPEAANEIKERIGWVNIMRDIQDDADPKYRYCGRVWDTEESAREMVSDKNVVSTIKIRWEE